MQSLSKNNVIRAYFIFVMALFGLMPATVFALDGELVEDGTFDVSLTNATRTTTGNVVLFANAAHFSRGNTPPTGVLTQTVTTEVGKQYILYFDYRRVGVAGIALVLDVNINGTAALVSDSLALPAGGAVQTMRYIFTADSTTTTIILSDNTAGAALNSDIILDNISVLEGPGGIANGMVGWFDGADITTVSTVTTACTTTTARGVNANQPADGNAVPCWQDKSGLNNHATQRAFQNAAVFEATTALINNQSSLDFTQTNSGLGSVYDVPGIDIRPTNLADMTVFTVYITKPSATSIDTGLWGADNGGFDRFFFDRLPSFTGVNEDGAVGLGPTVDQIAVVEDAGLPNIPRLLTIVYDGLLGGGTGPADASFVQFDGETVTTFTDSSAAAQQPNLSIGWDGDGNPADSFIAEMIVFDRVLDQCEINDVNEYLNAKYGTSFSSGAPGGVNCDPAVGQTLALWLKADAGVTGVTPITGWDDQSGNGINVATVNGDPALQTDTFNFNAAIDFDGTGDYLETVTQDLGDNLTFFVVGDRRAAGAHVLNHDPDFNVQIGGAGLYGGAFENFNDNALNRIDFRTGIINRNATSFLRTNGTQGNNPTAGASLGGDIPYVIGANGLGAAQLDGRIAEVIVYDADADTGTQLQQIESYLAIKYGITLNNGDTAYLDSSSNTVWAVDATYDSDIFGIARDDASALDQRVSSSVNQGSVLAVALDADFSSANNAASRTTAFANDKQFMMFANNAATTALQDTELDTVTTALNFRIGKEWRATNVGSVGPVSLKFNGLGNYTLISTPDGDFSAGVTVVGVLDANGQIDNVTIVDGQTYTVGVALTDTDDDDGVDINDIDDDNDGILDTVEGLSVVNFAAGSNAANYAGTTTLGVNVDVNLSFSPFVTDFNQRTDRIDNDNFRILSTPASLSDTNLLFGSSQIDGFPATLTFDFSGEPVNEFRLHVNSVDQFRIGYTIANNVGFEVVSATSSNNTNGADLDFGDDDTSTNDASVPDEVLDGLGAGSADGTIRFFSLDGTPISSIQLSLTEQAGNNGNSDGWQFAAEVLLDTDGDNVSNIYDLDSDNDGIPDNVEAQTTLGYVTPNLDAGNPSGYAVNAMGLNTAYTGGLTPLNFDGADTPDYLDLDSDNDGIGDATESGTKPVGIIGNNGLVASSETVDNFTDVNGIFDTPSTALSDIDNDVNSGGDVDFRDILDLDADGVPNAIDLDDDNDGIPDLVELETTGGLAVLSRWTANAGGGAVAGNLDPDSIDASFATNVSPLMAGPGVTLTGDAIQSSVLVDGLDSATLAEAESNGDYVEITFTTLNNYGSLDELAQGIINPPSQFGYSFAFEISANGFASPGNVLLPSQTLPQDAPAAGDPFYVFLQTPLSMPFLLEPNTEYTVRAFLFANPASNDAGGTRATLNDFHIFYTSRGDGDFDGDGIPNHLDLDVDNDGIPDNIEAQTTSGYIAPNTAAPSGANQSGYAVDSNGVNTAYSGGLTPVNTDLTATTSDTVPDYRDSDSDNDGFNDTTEAGLTLTGLVGANGLVASSDIAADDYTDVNGVFDETQTDNFPDSDSDVALGVVLISDLDYRDDTPIVDFTLATTAAQSVTEGDTGTTAVTATIGLSSASGKTVTVPYVVTGTATGGTVDYTLASGVATFAAGVTEVPLNFTVTGDLIDEQDETIIITLGAPTNATAGTAIQEHTVTITDDDTAVVDFTVATTAAQSIAEGNTGTTAGVATVGLSTSSSQVVTVPYTISGSATGGGTDFTLADGTVTIAAGDTTADINFTVAGDVLDELDETIIITLGTPTNATAGTTTQTHTVTITDDDATPTAQLSLAAQSVPEGNSGVTSFNAEINLSAASTFDVTIPVTVTAGSATAATGFPPVAGDDFVLANFSPVITAGSTSFTIQFGIVGDLLSETNEDFTITLGTPTNATVSGISAQVVTITDDDVGLTSSTLVASPNTLAADGATSSTITVQLQNASGENLTASGGVVALSTTGSAVLSAVTDNGDGTYTATVTNIVAETVTISGTLAGAALADTDTVTFAAGAADPNQSVISATPTLVVADGVATSTITVQLLDSNGTALNSGGDTVTLDSTGNGSISAVTDNGDGTYTATITNTTAEIVTISGMVNAAPIGNMTSVTFTPDNTNPDPTNTNSTIAAAPTSVLADGTTTSTITVQIADANGNLLSASGGTVALSSTGSAVISAVTDNGDGTYTATVTNSTAETVTISGTLDGTPITNTGDVTFTVDNSNADPTNVNTTIVAGPSSVVADGVTTSTITVQLADPNGNLLTGSGGTVALTSSGSGVITAVTDNGDGSYTATVTNATAETVTISGTLDGAAITDTADVTFTPDNSNADPTNINTTIVAGPSSVVADGTATSTVTIQLADANGNLLTASGGIVALTSSGGAVLSAVTDNGDGTYTATVTNTTAETVTISGTLDGVAITDTADVAFTADNTNADPTNANTTLVAGPSSVVADGVMTSTITVQLADVNGNLLTASGGLVALSSTGSAVVSAVTDNGDGSYTATVTNTTAETVTISGTLDGAAITDTADVTFTVDNSNPDPSNVNTTIVAGPTALVADGGATSTITVQLADANGNLLTASGGVVALSSSGNGMVSAVIDNGDGTYTATITNTTAETVTISGTLDGAAITDTADVTFTTDNTNPDATNVNTTIVAGPSSVVADGVATSTVTVQLADPNGNLLTSGGATVILNNTGDGVLSTVTDNGDGTYTATITNTTAETVTISGSVNGAAITDTADVTFTADNTNPDPANVNTTIVAGPVSVVADGVTTSTITVQLADDNGNLLTADAGVVALTSSGSGVISAVTPNGDGTYTATITNTVAESVTISGTLDGVAITDTADVIFTADNSNPDAANVNTTIVVAPANQQADGVSASTITVQLSDANGNLLTMSAGTVVLSTPGSATDVLSAVTDNGDGTYTATITNTVAEAVTISGTLDGNAITDTAVVTFSANANPPDAANVNTTIVAGPSSVVADGSSTATITVQLADSFGNTISVGGATVTLSTPGSTTDILSGVTDNGDGTYTATIANTIAETVTISGTVNGAAITDTADVIFTADNSNPDATNVNTTIVAAPASVVADGTMTSTITVQLSDVNGNLITASAGTVVLSSTGTGMVSAVVDNLDGSYTATVTNTTAETVTISGTLDGAAITDTADVIFTPDNSNASPTNVNTTIVAGPVSVVADGTTTSTITVQLADVNGNLLSGSGGTVVLMTPGSTTDILSGVTDNGDGTYTATIANTIAETVTISGTLNGVDITDMADVSFTPDNSNPDPTDVNTTIVAGPSSVVADGTTMSTITVQLSDANGNLLSASGGLVALTTNGSAIVGPVTDNGDGTYTATITNTTAETVTISGTLDGAMISDMADVIFTADNTNPDPANVNTTIVAGPSSVVADGTVTSTVTVQLSDVNGNLLTASAGTVALTSTGSGVISAVVDNGDGTYTATITNTTAETVTISGTLGGVAIVDTADVIFTPDNANPDPANVNTTIVAGPSSVVADGAMTSTITVQLSDDNGNLLTASAGVVVLTSTGTGVVSAVVDNGDGTYTATVTNTTAETVSISGTLDGTPIADTSTVAFTPDNTNPNPAGVNTTIVAGPSSAVADGVATSTITVQLSDTNGNLLTASGGTVALTSTGSGVISAVVDNGNGSYTATITNTVAEPVTISGTLGGVAIADTADVIFTPDNSNPDPTNVNTTIVAGPSSVVADGVATSTITVQLSDVNGNPMSGSGGTVALSVSGSAVISAVVDNGDGTYTATVTNTTAETVSINGTLDGNPITDTADLTFTTDNSNPDPTNVNTTITAVGSTVAADGTAESTVTVRLADANGNPLTSSGGTVALTSTGSAVISAVVDNGDGTYTATVTNAVQENVTITGTLDGVAITDDAEIYFNGAPPPVVIDSITTTTTMVTGTAEPGTTISLTGLTCDNAPVVTDITGNWVCDTVTVPPVEGTTVTAIATDANGNDSPPSSTVVTNAATTSAAPSINVIDDDDLMITGMATPGATIVPSVACDNAPVVADDQGFWTCDITTAGTQVVGTIVTATAQEPGLAISPQSSTPVISAVTSVGTPTIDPTDGTQVTGTCDVPNAAVDIFNVTVPALVCMTTADAAGAFTCTPLTPAPSNADVLSVTCTDPVTGEPSPPTIVGTDLMPPVLTGDNIPLSTDTTPTLTGTSDQPDGSTVEITDAAGDPVCSATVTAGVWSCDVPTALPEGTTTFTATQSDPLGNEATVTFTVTVNLDADDDGIPDDQEPPRPTDTDGDGVPDADDDDADGDGIPDREECGPTLPCLDTDGDGVPDFLEPNNIDSDGDGIPNHLDNDDDGDGIPTADELGSGGSLNPADTDGDGIPDYLEPGNNSTDPNSDSDGDGVPDAVECLNGVCDDTDGNSIPDYLEDDSDQDGIPDTDECPSLPCADADADGIPDYLESNTADFDGDGIPNNQDLDDDGDGIPTLTEVGGPGAPLKRQDTDGDGLVDYLDVNGTADSDGDGRSDAEECGMALPCPDSDYDNIPDYLDTDDDNDGIPSSAEMGDSDGDGVIDALESDTEDLDGDGIVDADDTDDDGDGIPTASEGTADADGDRIPDYLEPNNIDSDGDGTTDNADSDDNNDGISTLIQTREGGSKFTDSDGDGIPDYLDGAPNGGAGGGDSDGDGISDAEECPGGYICPDADGNGIPDYAQAGLPCEATDSCIVLTGTTKGGGSMGWIGLLMLLALWSVKGRRVRTRDPLPRILRDPLNPQIDEGRESQTWSQKFIGVLGIAGIVTTFTLAFSQSIYAHPGNNHLDEVEWVTGERFATEYAKYKSNPDAYCDSDYASNNKEARRVHSAYCSNDWYFGVAAMQNRLTPLPFQTDYVVTGDSDGGFKVFVGKRLWEHYRVEGFLATLGTAELTSRRFGVGTIDYNLLYGANISRDFHLFNPRLTFYPKVGFSVLDDSPNNIQRSRENDLQFYAGFGFEFNVNQSWGIRAEYENFTNDIESVSVGLTYQF